MFFYYTEIMFALIQYEQRSKSVKAENMENPL